MVYEIETIIPYYDVEGCTDKDTEEAINSKDVRLINDRRDFDCCFVCFNYVLDDIYGYLNYCEEAYDILQREYEKIDIKNSKKGDIISYHEINDFNSKYEKPCEGNALHFAIIQETKRTLKSTIIRSKWGKDGVFETNLSSIPDIYGNAIVIWRKKDEYNT